MHEVSIAQNILLIVEKEAEKKKASKIHLVKIILGQFTGVVKEALEFALEVVKKNSIADKAIFKIETISLQTFCPACNKDYDSQNEMIFQCPSCKGNLDIVRGKEMYIDYIDLE